MKSAKDRAVLVSIYRNKFCTRADDVFRLGFYLYLDVSLARKFSERVFSRIVKLLRSTDDPEAMRQQSLRRVYQACWETHRDMSQEVAIKSEKIQKIYGQMSELQRSAFIFNDIVGLSSAVVNDFVQSDAISQGELSEARRIFIEK